MAISIRQDTWLLHDLYRERKKCLEVLLCRLVQRRNFLYLFSPIWKFEPYATVEQNSPWSWEGNWGSTEYLSHETWHPLNTSPGNICLGKKTTVNLKQEDLAEGGLFISHAAQALWCEVFEMTVATKDRSSGKEHALGTCCGSSSCEEDISLENRTQHSISATSIKWKKANLFPKSQTIYNQCTY